MKYANMPHLFSTHEVQSTKDLSSRDTNGGLICGVEYDRNITTGKGSKK